MYARITTYRITPDKLEETLTLAEKIKPEIMSIPGIKYWFNIGNSDGNCAVIAIYNNEAAAEAAQQTAKELFGRFAEYIESDLQAQGYQVLLHDFND